jgi:hypothetical protein
MTQLRLILAEAMFEWILGLAPKDDPDGARMVQAVAAYFHGSKNQGSAGEPAQPVRIDFVPQDGQVSNYFDCTVTALDGSPWRSLDGVWRAVPSPQ